MARPAKSEAVDLSVPVDITAGMIERLRCPDDKAQAFLRDKKAPGLRVRVTVGGAKSFVFEAKLHRQTIRRTIGDALSWSIDDARAAANRLRVQIDSGADPRETDRQQVAAAEALKARQAAEKLAQQAREHHTLRALCKAYCDHLKARGRDSWRDAEGIFENHLLAPYPARADTPASEFTKSDAVAAQRRLIEAGKKTTARKLRAYLRAAYTCAVRAESDSTLPAVFIEFRIVDNPVANTAPITGGRDKNPLPATDLRKYWATLKRADGEVGAALRLHLLCGAQRVAQLVRLNADADIMADTLRLWDRKGKRQEAREHLLPITKAIRAELKRLPGAGYVLSTDGGKTPMHPTSLTTWAREMATAAGLKGFQLKRVRSGVETLLAESGVPLHVRGQLQSHGISGVQAAHYDAHSYLPEKRQALEALHGLLERKPAKNVTPIKAARKRA